MQGADLLRMVVALVVVVVAARLFGRLARAARQPQVVGEILAGILLGPTVAGGAVATAVFPAEIRPALSWLATVAVCVFMFFVGLHLDRSLLRGQVRIAASVSLGAVLVPFALGCLLALYLVRRQPVHDQLGFVLFLGTAMSVTAFPVLARILRDSGLAGTPVGVLALACAAVDDVLAWSLLAVVVAVAVPGSSLWLLLLVAPFTALLVTVVRPLLAAAERGLARRRLGGLGALAVAAAGLYMCAEGTDRMGLHPIFGAFMFGAVFPRLAPSGQAAQLLRTVERFNATLLLPVFFLIVGLKVDLSRVGSGELAVFALILVVAVAGKGLGAFAGARLCGAGPRHAVGLAVLLNTRGLTELIALTVGLQLGLLDADLYSLMVVMALVTTAMTGNLLPLVYPPERVSGDVAARNSAQGAPA